KSQTSNPFRKFHQILGGAAPFSNTIPHHPLNLRTPLLQLYTPNQSIHLLPNLLLRDHHHPIPVFSLKPQPNLPNVADIARIQKLVRKVRPAKERDSISQPFHGGIPAAVAHEATHRWMPQYFLLRRPTDYLPLFLPRPAHSVQNWFYLRGYVVGPNHPAKWPVREFQPEREFLELGWVEPGGASECNVNDRIGRVLIQPIQQHLILLSF
ncbi:unnamed protein product, partial [Linum tenue]